MLLAILRNLLQQRLGLRFDNRQLVEHGRVEHHVGILLIRKDPFVFARSDAGPAANGLPGVHATILIVADDAPQKAIVGSRDVVVVVEKDGGEGRSIYPELPRLGYPRRQFGIEGMDSLHDEYVIIGHAESLVALFAPSRLKIIPWE